MCSSKKVEFCYVFVINVDVCVSVLTTAGCFPCCQVLWGGAVGDQHSSRAALPGPVQRAGPQVRHGGGIPGPAR